VDRPHLQVNNTNKTLSGGPAGGVYPPFCEGLQTAWFAAGLQQIFFRRSSVGGLADAGRADDSKAGRHQLPGPWADWRTAEARTVRQRPRERRGGILR
jgi:hypothetical protein